jgi:hypothetical protein
MRVWLLCIGLAHADSPRSADPSPRPLVYGRLDVDQLERDGKRNFLAGNLLAGAGAVVGGVSTGLLITGLVRSCPANMPGCNDTINTASTWVGAAALVFVTVGVGLFAVGMTQRRIVRQLRGPQLMGAVSR